MDRRSLVLLVLTCGLLVAWPFIIQRIYPPKPVPTNVVTTGATPALPPATGESGAGPVVPPVTQAVKPGFTVPGFVTSTNEARELVLENEVSRYVFTSRGGGIREVALKKYQGAIKCRDRNGREAVGPAVMNQAAPTPMFALLGLESPMADLSYELSMSNDVVVARRELENGLRVVKEFRLGTNYLVHATVRLQNWGMAARAVPTQEWVFGTAAPLHPEEQAIYLGLYDNDGSSSEHIGEGWFANRTLGCFPGTPKTEYLGSSTNTAWAAVHNQFFATMVLPKDRSARVFARHIDLPFTNGVAGRAHAGYQAALLYPGEEIPAQQERVREFSLFVGPKEYGTIASLGNNADALMGFDNYFGGRFSGFFARMLLLAMNGLNRVGFSYGLAIIAITVFVRLLFWPLMKASARTSKRMAALQPQIKELQEKYKDNPQKLNQKMLELWRTHKINPAAGCLPILIQFPILLGFYAMLQTAIELRGESFLWACDLSQTDTIGVIPGLDFPINPLPLMMGVSMFFQAQLTPMSPSMDVTQQRIMKYMPLIFMGFLYNFSAGLTLYWTVSNVLSIAQMKMTRAQEEKSSPSPAGPAGPNPASKKPRPGSGPGAGPRGK